MSNVYTIDPSLPSCDTEGVKALIPHRYPMLMIDKIVNIRENKSVLGVKFVSPDDPYFPGHFPNHPVMPGVLIVEAMAQSAGALVVHSMGKEAHGKVVYFMTIESAKFRKPVLPGDTLHIFCDVIQSRGMVWKFAGTAYVNGQKVAESTYSAMIMDKAGA